MIYIAHISYYDEFEGDIKQDKILLTACSYTNAMELIEEYYRDTIETVDHLESISDSNITHLDDESEQHIKEHPHNGFF